MRQQVNSTPAAASIFEATGKETKAVFMNIVTKKSEWKKRVVGALLLAGITVSPAFATDKNVIQLQVQVQQLEDSLARMHQTQDERWALTKAGMDQDAATMQKISATLAAIQSGLAAQQDSSRSEQLSSQMQSINDSVDEVKARLGRLEKQLNDMAATQQNIQNAPAANGPGGGAAQVQPQGGAPDNSAAAAAAPPIKDLYQSAYRDYSGGRYDLASQEFAQVVQAYPQDDLSGAATFYQGEIAYRQGKYRDAAKYYDQVLQQFPGNTKCPAAQLRKGDALIQLGERSAGVKELRALIQRYPQSPESGQARSQLNGMGVTIVPKPSASRTE
jgi:tol-pal system protein YbgF